jgi:hypothetical protein
MASIRPRTDRPRQPQKSRFWKRVISALSITSLTLAPVMTLALWLMISDPVTAAAVMERGDLLPVIAAIVKVMGKAMVAMLSAL